MAQLITTDGTRTTVRPANGTYFTLGELEGLVGGSLDIKELPGPLYSVSVRNAREIGAEQNRAAMAGHVIHMAHLEVEGKLPLDGTRNPPPDWYGTVLFCSPEEMGEADTAYTEGASEV